jgi:phytoene dehydrogenase-like protein
VGSIPNALAKRLGELGSTINTESEVVQLDALHHTLVDEKGNQYTYDKLIWCADMKHFYRMINAEGYSDPVKSNVVTEQEKILSSRGAESVFTLFLAVDLPPKYFGNISEGHFFYTPSKQGLGQLHRTELDNILATWEQLDRTAFYSWLESFCRLNTYEISIPVLNDSDAAPEGKAGLVVSFLFDHELTRRIEKDGWYKEFEQRISTMMIDTLAESVYPQLKDHILFSFTAGPLHIERTRGCSEGAIVGWSFEQDIPIDAGMLNMKKAVLTPIPDIYRAGQWTVSPAGLPTCIMTAKMAADLVHKELGE